MISSAWRIGVGRDDGAESGEHAAVFYKKERFEMMDSGNFWLSETPEKPSFGWDAQCRRICSWGKFREKNSGEIFSSLVSISIISVRRPGWNPQNCS